ncbi:MAG: ABC-F family ATP-binding cassette domain-containing protein [Candidatus Zixiibacteriota bacterium]|nr:MAG: ABC-F family ATP-binding cassette domain-containing protein [candidate division Zixibacteria bacterium]
MTLLAAERISKRFDEQVIFEQVSFTIKTGDRIGLVGKNGSGKTTLFELLAGVQEIDSGAITRSKKCIIDYAEQEKTEFMELSLFDFVASGRQDLLDMRLEMSRLQEHLAGQPGDRTSLARLGQLQNRYEVENGFNFENEIKTILSGLSFEESRYRDPIRNFSGGEKNRAGLARVLAGKGTLLLLDEPTNHLDISSTCWLEEYLSNIDRAFVVVSHDRTFLQNTVRNVWDIQSSKISFYTGSFEKYLGERAERRRLHEHQYKHQQEEIKRIEEFIRRNMAGQKTKQAQSRLKYLQRIKRLPPPKTENSSAHISVKSSGRSFAHVLAVHDVEVGYSSAIVSGLNFDIYRGDKVGLIGPNGSGKSTILKSIIGELAPINGDIRLGSNVDVAYFDQELSELDPDRTVLENLWEVDPGAEVGTMRSFLGRFGFYGDDSLKKVTTLSGGEKTKLSLARLLYHPANFIIFDEPTNHLDLNSREVLEEALVDYAGSCLIVSHDRYFLNRVVTRILHIHDGHLDIYDGNYEYFREKTASQAPAHTGSAEPASRQAYLDFKERSKYRARLKKDIKATRKRIAEFEKEIETLTEAINHQIPKSDWEKLSEATARKNELEDDILVLYQQLEQLEERELDYDSVHIGVARTAVVHRYYTRSAGALRTRRTEGSTASRGFLCQAQFVNIPRMPFMWRGADTEMVFLRRSRRCLRHGGEM